MDRRHSLKATIAFATSAGGILIPYKAQAAIDPVSWLLFIPSMVTAISHYFSASKNAELEREKLRLEGLRIQDNRTLTAAQLQIAWLGNALQSKALSHVEAVDAIKKVEALFNISSNYDNNGTGISVQAGIINVNRGLYGGSLNAPQSTNALSVFKQEGVVPVPVGNARVPTNRQQESMSTTIASSLGVSNADFEKNYGIISTRPFSRARNPTGNGADMQMITTVNKEALAQGKPAELNVFAA